MNKYNKYILLTSFALATVSCVEHKTTASIEPTPGGQASSNNTSNHPTPTNNTPTTKPTNTSTNNATSPKDTPTNDTTPPSDASTNDTTSPSDTSTNDTTPPSDTSTNDTTFPSDTSTNDTTPFSDASTNDTTSPGDTSTNDATPPSDVSINDTTPPSDTSTNDTTPPSDDSTNDTTPPSDTPTTNVIPPNNIPIETEKLQLEEKIKREEQKKQLEQNLAQAEADLMEATKEYAQAEKKWADLDKELHSTVLEPIRKKEQAINRLKKEMGLAEFPQLNGLTINFYQDKITEELVKIAGYKKTIENLQKEAQTSTNEVRKTPTKNINVNNNIDREKRNIRSAKAIIKRLQENIRPVLEKINALEKERSNIETTNTQKIEEHTIANEAYIQAGLKKAQLSSHIAKLQADIMLLEQNEN